MSLTGNLSNFRLGDLLQTLAQNRQWGVLRLRRGMDTRHLSISERGVAHLDLTTVARRRIEDRLLHLGCIDRAAWKHLRSPDTAKRSLLDLLKEVKGFDASVLPTIFKNEAGEQIHALLDWSVGDFELAEGATAQERELTPPLDVNALILEGARRIDERSAMGERLPDPCECFIALQETSDAPLTEEQAAIVASSDGKSSLRKIADKAVGELFSATKLVLELEDAGRIRRMSLDELLASVQAATVAQELDVARTLLDLIERTRLLETHEALIDLAARWKSISEPVRAAGVLVALAQRVEEQGDAARSVVVLREAVSLAPRDPRVRRKLLDALRALPDADPNKLYEALRDYLLVCADRGLTAEAPAIEEEILQRVPADAGEEARVGRSLGRLGRSAAAADLLARAGVRRRAAKRTDREAIDLAREALALAPEHAEAKKLFDDVSGKRASRRKATAGIAAAVVGLLGLAAVPFWCGSGSREVSRRLASAEALLEKGELKEAAAQLALVDESIASGNQRDRLDALRLRLGAAAPGSAEEEQWLTEQFTSASSRLDAQDYAGAFGLYDAILERRGDEKRRELITHRLQSIEKKLRQEPKHVAELSRALNPSAKSPVTTPSAALAELEQLSAPARRDGLARLAPDLETSEAAKLLSDSERASLVEAAGLAVAAIDQAETLIEPLLKQRQDAKQSTELEPLLVEGKKAEADGDARAAARAFARLRDQYAGTVLRDYLDERIRHWGAIVERLDAYERAVLAGDAAGARREMEELRAKHPDVNPSAGGTLPIEIRTTPKGAEISLDGARAGVSPVIVRPRAGAPGKLTAELSGYERAESTVPANPVGRVELTLSRKAAWTAQMEGSVSAPGRVVGGRWIVADRRGAVRAFDPATGAAAWTRQFETLGGISGSPVADGSRLLVVTVEGDVHAIDAATGQDLATVALRETVALGLALDDGVAAAVTDRDALHLLPRAGAALRAEPMFARATTPPCPGPKGFAVGASDGSVLAFGRDGRLRWRSLCGSAVGWLVADETGWIAFAGTRITRLDGATGAAMESQELPGAPVSAPAAHEASSWWVPVPGQVVEVDRRTLALRTRVDLASLVPSAMAPFAGGFIAACAPGALRLERDGTLRWARIGNGRAYVTLLSDALVGVAFENGEIVALPLDR